MELKLPSSTSQSPLLVGPYSSIPPPRFFSRSDSALGSRIGMRLRLAPNASARWEEIDPLGCSGVACRILSHRVAGPPLHRLLAAVKARAAYLTKQVGCYRARPTTLLRNCLTFLFNCFFLK
jgi:hypothetical protein